jgi:Phosphoribosyl transferase (PRTase)/PELOTA RNA binding domain
LANHIAVTKPQGITLVSLARAGTPIGILLRRLLQRHFGITASHYSISILRDVGIDANALRFILQRHPQQSLVFIDGWTGKGVIAKQLATSLQTFAATDGIVLAPDLYVLADLAGSAAFAATFDDYLVPSCLLNATVSGLVSRSVYNPAMALTGSFHTCAYYQHFAAYDVSRYFVDTVLDTIPTDVPYSIQYNHDDYQQQRQTQQALAAKFVHSIRQHYKVGHANYLKPGLGETTRVLLRRQARLLLLRETNHPSTQHLRWLAQEKSVPITVHPTMPYQAAALIQEVSP